MWGHKRSAWICSWIKLDKNLIYETHVEQIWTRLRHSCYHVIFNCAIKVLFWSEISVTAVRLQLLNFIWVVLHCLVFEVLALCTCTTSVCVVLLLNLQVTEFLVKVQLTWASTCCRTKTPSKVTNDERAQFPVSQWPKRKQNESKLISTHVDFRRTGSNFFLLFVLMLPSNEQTPNSTTPRYWEYSREGSRPVVIPTCSEKQPENLSNRNPNSGIETGLKSDRGGKG